jgi:hypothetical protein
VNLVIARQAVNGAAGTAKTLAAPRPPDYLLTGIFYRSHYGSFRRHPVGLAHDENGHHFRFAISHVAHLACHLKNYSQPVIFYFHATCRQPFILSKATLLHCVSASHLVRNGNLCIFASIHWLGVWRTSLKLRRRAGYG